MPPEEKKGSEMPVLGRVLSLIHIFHLQHGSAGDGGKVDVLLDHQRRHAAGHALGGVVVAVPLGTHDADEKPTRGRLAAVVDDVLDVKFKACLLYTSTGYYVGTDQAGVMNIAWTNEYNRMKARQDRLPGS